MIEFSLDGRSGVSPYLQVVQQVRQALRLGLLREGDQLPTVKDVVARLAINPNTVLKAYRELERDGLVAARPGVGTFVTRTLTDDSLAAHEPLRRDLRALAGQGPAGRPGRREHRGAVREHVSRRPGGRSVTAVLRAEGLGKRYRRRWALRGLHPRDPGRARHRAGRPQRRRQDHAAEPGRRAARADRRHDRGAAAAGRPPTRSSSPRSASSPRTPRRTPGSRVADHLRLGARLNPRWDDAVARSRVERLGLDPTQRAGRLSGGQRAQLALTLGLAKRPELLILDEPVASLDPLARREFLQVLMEAVAEHELSVVLSSHVVSDLERVCDHLVVLVDSEVRVEGDVETLLATHHRLTGPRRDPATLPADQHVVVGEPHRPAEHPRRPHRRTRPRPGLDGRAGSAWRTSCWPTWSGTAAPHAPGPVAGGAAMIWLTWRQFRLQAARRRRRRGRLRGRRSPSPVRRLADLATA